MPGTTPVPGVTRPAGGGSITNPTSNLQASRPGRVSSKGFGAVRIDPEAIRPQGVLLRVIDTDARAYDDMGILYPDAVEFSQLFLLGMIFVIRGTC